MIEDDSCLNVFSIRHEEVRKTFNGSLENSLNACDIFPYNIFVNSTNTLYFCPDPNQSIRGHGGE